MEKIADKYVLASTDGSGYVIPVNNTMVITINSGDTTIMALEGFFSNTENEVGIFEFWEGSKWDGGDRTVPLKPYQANKSIDRESNTSVLSIVDKSKPISKLADGVKLASIKLTQGTATFSALTLESKIAGWKMKPNTNYTVCLINRGKIPINIYTQITWLEERL